MMDNGVNWDLTSSEYDGKEFKSFRKVNTTVVTSIVNKNKVQTQ